MCCYIAAWRCYMSTVSSPTIPVRTTDPAFEPVTLAQARRHVGLPDDFTYHDDKITEWIKESREQVEHDTGIISARGTFTYKLDTWRGNEIDLPLRPVQSITSIGYTDNSGASQTVTASYYALATNRLRPAIYLTHNSEWPDNRGHTNDITVTLIAGYDGPTQIPSMFKQAVLINVGRCLADREGSERGEQDLAAYVRAYEMLIRRLSRASYP